MSDENSRDRFPLSDVIEQLRQELTGAIAKSEGKDIRFKVNEIEVELKTVIEEGVSGDGGFNFGVLKFTGGLNDKSAETQTIKLKLEPIKASDASEESNEVAISGPARRISSNNG